MSTEMRPQSSRTHREDERSRTRMRGLVVAGAALIAVAGGTVIAVTALTGGGEPLPPRVTSTDPWTKESTLSSRGSAPLGSRSPTPPPDAIYVDADAADGGDGSEGSPFASISAAVDAVSSGMTIVLREGTYEEQVFLVDSPGRPLQDVTLQSYPGEEVWLDGSREVAVRTEDGRTVADWQDSPTWNNYQSFGDHDEEGELAVVGEQNPVAADPTEVWVNGERLWQVDSDPGPGQFAIERADRRDARSDTSALLVFGAEPEEGAQVRASYRGQAVVGKINGLDLIGFGVRGYATPVNWMGTVFLEGQAPQVRDLIFEDLPSIPLFLSGATDGLVENVTVLNAGLQGISAVHSDGATFRANYIEGANYQLFNPAPIAGGMKVGQMSDFIIEDTAIIATHEATGLWVDESGIDFQLVNNLVTNSGRNGIQVEISGRAVVAGNVLVDNHETGVQVYGSEDVTVANNLIAGSGSRGGSAGNIVVLQDHRRAADGGMGVDTRGVATGLSWVNQDIVIESNVLATPNPAAAAQVLAFDHTGEVSADDMGITVRGNIMVDAIDTSTGTRGIPVAQWHAGEDVSLESTEEAAQRLPGWHDNAMLPAGNDVEVLTAAIGDTAADMAMPLSEDVARALGLNAGSRLVGPPTLTTR